MTPRPTTAAFTSLWPFVALALAGATAAGCKSQCEALRDRADSCGAVRGRYVDINQSVCTATRQDIGAERFDTYADCVLTSPCDDLNAIDRCMDEHYPRATESACMEYRMWSSACGLEPTGGQFGCPNIGDGVALARFEGWVDCMTHGGCLLREDDRFETCGNELLPPSVTNMLDACARIAAWTEECQGMVIAFVPIEPVSVPQCLAQSDPFTSESYLAHAECLAKVPCGDAAGYVDCLLMLELKNRGALEEQCQELVDYDQQCGSVVSGGDLEVCRNIFVRFSPESITAYLECLRAPGCADPQTILSCGSLLEIQ